MKLDLNGKETKNDEDNCSEGDPKISNNGSRKGSTESEKSKKLTAKEFLGEEKISPLVRGLLSDKTNDDNDDIEKELSEAVEIRAESKRFSEGLSSSGSSTERTVLTVEEEGRKSRKSGVGSVCSSRKASSRGGSAVTIAGRRHDHGKSASTKVTIQEPSSIRKKSSSLQMERVGMQGKLSSGSAKGRTSAKKR